jgi:hypothetical protein
MLMRRVRGRMHATGVRNNNVGIRVWNSAIDITHQQMTAEKRTNLGTPE